MRRIQLHLDEELDAELARQAFERRMPKAALIREYLWQHVRPGRAKDDPSARLIGSYEGDADETTRIDEVLYGP